MRAAVYGAVLIITLGSIVLGLDWLSAPMSPMVDTEAGLHAAVPPPVAPGINITAPAALPAPLAPKANIGAPIVPPRLVVPAAPVAPTVPNVPVQAGAAAEAAPSAPVAAPESTSPPPNCNVAACTAAYFSFRASDCTYQPSNGPRKLCTRQAPPPPR